MNKKSLAIALLTLGFVSSQAMAQESPWLVRARAVHLDYENKSDAFPGVAADKVTVNNKTIPEVDISYFFTSNVAAELILTVPQKQNVAINGNRIGSFTHLPPVMTVQYHFSPESQFSPYVGAGVNYTRIFDVKLGGLKLDKSSVGFALQAGIDYKIDKKWLLNFDVKKVQIGSDVKSAAGNKVTSVTLDPWLIGVGVGYRF